VTLVPIMCVVWRIQGWFCLAVIRISLSKIIKLPDPYVLI